LLADNDLPGASKLLSSTLRIVSGDLNLVTTSELEYITSKSFKDSITSSEMDPAVESANSATIGLTYFLPEYTPRRSDFVLYNGDNWECSEHIHFGDMPVMDDEGAPLFDDRGTHNIMYPSDHLGVLVQFVKVHK
jgi:hypothetical protein